LSKELRVVPRKKTLAPHVGLRTNWTTDGMSRGSYLSSTRTLSVARHCGNFVGSSKVNEGVVALFGGPVNADILTDQVSWRDQTVTIFGSFVGTLFRVLNCVECHIHSVRADLEALTLAIIPWHAADVIFCFRIVTFHYGLRTQNNICVAVSSLQQAASQTSPICIPKPKVLHFPGQDSCKSDFPHMHT